MGYRVKEQLQKYWVYSNGVHRFRNGLTQNGVAASMGVEPSLLSRLVHGHRHFTPKQLEDFVRIVELSNDEALELQKADIADRMRGDPPIQWEPSSAGVALLHYTVETTKGLGRGGQPQEALELFKYLGEEVDRQLEYQLKTNTRRDLLRVRAEIHLGIAYALEYVSGGLDMQRIGEPEYHAIEQLSEELGDTSLIPRLRIHQAVGSYISGEFDDAVKILEEVRSRSDIPGTQYRLFANRALILSLAYGFHARRGGRWEQGQTSRESRPIQALVREIDAETQALLERDSLADERHVAMYMEGLARVYGLLGDRGKAFKLLAEGQKYLESRERSLGRLPIVWAQYGRTWVEVLSLDSRGDDSYMSKWADETKRVARGRYPRYLWLINQSLERAEATNGDQRSGRQMRA